MGLCLGAQINKQDISKPRRRQQVPEASSPSTECPCRELRVLSPPGARSPSWWVIPAGMQLESGPSPLQQTSRTPGSLLCPQSPGQLCQCDPHGAGQSGRALGSGALRRLVPSSGRREQHPHFFRAQRRLENVLLKHSCLKGNQKGHAVQPKCSTPALLRAWPTKPGGDRLSKAGAGLKPTRKVQLAEHS